ncbi:unnamed protein product [Caenorhabditis nigoni]
MSNSWVLIFLLLSLLQISTSHPTTNFDICEKLNCKKDEKCDSEAVKCVDGSEGRPCEVHTDCNEDYICYAGKCIFFIGRH